MHFNTYYYIYIFDIPNFNNSIKFFFSNIVCLLNEYLSVILIAVNFSQKHEIRQVYIRSTARAYEIYCAPSFQSDNEYLCTVRCSPVINLETSTVISPKEDDWVDVGRVGEGNPVLPNQVQFQILGILLIMYYIFRYNHFRFQLKLKSEFVQENANSE